MNTTYAVITVLTAGIITFLIRLFPFVLMAKFKNKMPDSIVYLGNILPQAAIAILLIYCLKDINFTSAAAFLPQAIALAFAVILHLYKKNFILSIAVSTAVYMVLVQRVFV